jgi:hypothetical protein
VESPLLEPVAPLHGMYDVFLYSTGNDCHSPSLFISMNLTLNMTHVYLVILVLLGCKQMLLRQDVKCYVVACIVMQTSLRKKAWADILFDFSVPFLRCLDFKCAS